MGWHVDSVGVEIEDGTCEVMIYLTSDSNDWWDYPDEFEVPDVIKEVTSVRAIDPNNPPYKEGSEDADWSDEVDITIEGKDEEGRDIEKNVRYKIKSHLGNVRKKDLGVALF